MRRLTRVLLALSACAVTTATLSACASGAASEPTGVPAPPLVGASTPEGDVVGQGTVIDVAGDAQLCLGAVMESYPPQCAGLPLIGWSWQGLDGSERSGDVTRGSYAVQGTYDGETLTVTQPPILLALYDPIAEPDPTDGKPGTTDEATLLDIQDELVSWLGDRMLTSAPSDGRLHVTVVWDGGELQQEADDSYGEGVVIISSALREIGG